MNPTATVIIPVFNRALVIKRALDSVRDQDYRPIELIVIDDASTDELAERIERWAESNASGDLTVHYIRNRENRGPGGSRNVGVYRATGEFIYFLDSDDRMAPSLLTLAIHALDEADTECVIFGFEAVSGSSPARCWLPPDQPALRAFLQNMLWGYTFTSVKRAALVRRTGPWIETARVGEDYEFLGRALLRTRPPVILRKVLLTTYALADSLGALKMTEAGLRDRLSCERSIVTEVHARREHIPATWLTDYGDRLLTTSLRTMAQGKRGFAQEVKAMAVLLRAGRLTRRQRMKSAIVLLGPLPCRIILALVRFLRHWSNW